MSLFGFWKAFERLVRCALSGELHVIDTRLTGGRAKGVGETDAKLAATMLESLTLNDPRSRVLAGLRYRFRIDCADPS